MSTKHTVGIWHTGKTHAGEIAVFADNKQNTQICTIEPLMDSEESEANAARIVQCVNSHDELVEALKNLVNLSYETARPTRAEIDHCIGLAETALKNVGK